MPYIVLTYLITAFNLISVIISRDEKVTFFMRFEVITFRDYYDCSLLKVMPCSSVDRCQFFVGHRCLSFRNQTSEAPEG
jgi:hypothetical protein